MPFIRIKSLPFERPVDIGRTVKNLTRDFAAATGIGLEHVSAVWEFFAPGHYAVGGETASRQPADSHPLLVEILAPDFNSPEQIETMLSELAAGISARTGIPLGNIFIEFRPARSGWVFDGGAIERW